MIPADEVRLSDNAISYRTDYLNVSDDSFIGSVIAASPNESYSAPSSASPDVLEIITTVIVTKGENRHSACPYPGDCFLAEVTNNLTKHPQRSSRNSKRRTALIRVRSRTSS